MKIALFLILALSTLCDLEAQQQPESLVPESQKNDILIPTSGAKPIKVSFSNNVQSLNVDGHQINVPANKPQLRRHLNSFRRRNYHHMRHLGDSDPSSTPDDQIDQEGQDGDIQQDNTDSNGNTDEAEYDNEDEDYCPNPSNPDDLRDILTTVFKEDNIDSLQQKSERVNEVISKLEVIQADPEGKFEVDVGLAQEILNDLLILKDIKGYFACDNSENSQDDDSEYSDFSAHSDEPDVENEQKSDSEEDGGLEYDNQAEIVAHPEKDEDNRRKRSLHRMHRSSRMMRYRINHVAKNLRRDTNYRQAVGRRHLYNAPHHHAYLPVNRFAHHFRQAAQRVHRPASHFRGYV